MMALKTVNDFIVLFNVQSMFSSLFTILVKFRHYKPSDLG